MFQDLYLRYSSLNYLLMKEHWTGRYILYGEMSQKSRLIYECLDRNITQTCTSAYPFCVFLWVINENTLQIYSSAPVFTGNTFQDLPRIHETADNTERYI
jgi:hypothetical protein